VWTLGIDTATWSASVGVARDRQVIAERGVRAETHALALIPLIEETLAAAALTVRDLAAIAVSAGPGSFTGLRIGLSTAKGLAYAYGAQLVLVPTLRALARAAGPRRGLVCTLLDARKGEIYAAAFRWRGEELQPTVADCAIAPHQLRDLIRESEVTFIGDGVDRYGDRLRELFPSAAQLGIAAVPPSGAIIAQMGWECLEANGGVALNVAEPFYIRASEAEKNFG
jgi:tRNA threonylcarbamoyladenosine biosynthesis protein TsaB